MTEKTPRIVVDLSDVAMAEEGLTRIPLMKAGRFVKGKQKFAITAQVMSDVVKNFRKRQADVVIDYEHASMDPTIAMGDMVPAAGWLKEVEDGPDASGILWGKAEFTDKARKAIAAKEIRYISPELDSTLRDKGTGEPQGVTMPSLALTNRPFLEALPAIALSDSGWKEIDRGDAGDEGRKESNVVKVALADRVARTVRLTAEDGSESTLVLEGLEAPMKVIALSDVKRDDKGRLDFASLDVQLGADKVVASEVFRVMQAEAVLDQAIADCKILPSQREFYGAIALSDLGKFREFLKTAPKVLDTKEHGIGGGVDVAKLDDFEKVEKLLLSEVEKKITASGGKMQYHDALKAVGAEQPELQKRYTMLQRKRSDGGKD